MASKIDSNLTGLRIAEELTLGVLPVTPTWIPLEPNSYSDFGGQITTVAREPINPSRQRKKGVVTDLDASGGFSADLTQVGQQEILQGLFFADTREKTNLAASAAVAGSPSSYTVASGGTAFAAGALIYVTGFVNSANNGIKRVDTGSTATSIPVVDTLVSETATGLIRRVGVRAGTGDLTVDATGDYVTIESSTLDFTTLGLVAGEWIYVGGDAANTDFAIAANNGFKRVRSVVANALVIDKSNLDMATDAGTGRTIEIYFGDLLKNESDPNLIIRRTYNVERTLSEDNDGTMSEYLVGAVMNEFVLNLPTADKATFDLSFVATDNEQRTGLQGVKTGNRPALTPEDAYNTSTDVRRLRLSTVSPDDESVTELFAYLSELTITVNNNVTPNKAVSVLGAFEVTAGNFEVGAQITAYFSDVTAVSAVRQNADVSLDVIIARDNAGHVIDIPLVSLGDGRLNVEKDAPITLPLEATGAESVFGHTMLWGFFHYLPNVATPAA